MAAVIKDPLEKIKHFCAYQERSHFEVKQKLYSLGLHFNKVEELLAKLIEENYLNEERFAQSFARGKFRIKRWGRVKIKYELKAKKVSEYNIKNALKQIDEGEYTVTLQQLAEKKWAALEGENALTRQAKTLQYLLQRGFEMPLAQQAVKAVAGQQ